MATSKTGLGVKSEGQLIISGTKGYIVVDAPWWKTQSFEIKYEDKNNKRSVADIQKMQSLLWKPQVRLDEGIGRVLKD